MSPRPRLQPITLADGWMPVREQDAPHGAWVTVRSLSAPNPYRAWHDARTNEWVRPNEARQAVHRSDSWRPYGLGGVEEPNS